MGGGCALALLGTLTTLFIWSASRRTGRHLGGGFEGEGRDLSVLWTELPLTLLAGALIPSTAWLLTLRLPGGHGRRGSRVVLASACAAGALALSAWGLHTWANPDPAPSALRLSGAPASELDQ